ncbi:LysM peptidoglycan-binding domain-containing protein [Moraxella oblonga]|uniref:LysM peptidoglycan-binding domain-containing protein n=1 Tax=Moraxella oblonga TaxID=200413 RepID=UPI00082A4C26|nr:LysM peptidoglycan-binding domain-containing protein [Moraxella oblonga]
MKSFNVSKRTSVYLKPLAIAISPILMVACVAPQRDNAPINTSANSIGGMAQPSYGDVNAYGQNPYQAVNTNVNTNATTNPATNPNIYQNPYSVPNTYQNTYQTPNNNVLDQATLDELEDLLQATDMSMVEGDNLTIQRYGNLWDRVRRGYRIQQFNNNRIEAQKSWFYGRQDYINRLTARTSRYLYHTVAEAERRGIPTELALLPIIESSYDPSATSNAAAAGLWQFIPSTGRIYGLNQSMGYDGRRDVIESTRAAYDFLTSLYNQFGSWELALAAYNAGPARIQKAIDANRQAGLPTDYWSLRLPAETMNYVPRFLAVAQIIGAPNNYGVSLPAIANHAHFRAVPTNYGVSLYDVARITGVAIEELRFLNPALTYLKVDETGPGRVIIPNSIPNNIDGQLSALAGDGRGGATTYMISDYVPLRTGGTGDTSSAQVLASTNTLPTTNVQITNNNTIIQEPPLSQEERDFIAGQIRVNSVENVQPISNDGNINLSAIQTGQSVLESRGQVKSLSFNAPNAQTGNVQLNNTNNVQSGRKNNNAISNKPRTQTTTIERYKVVAGDTLTGIASKHGLSVSQLASYNGVPTNYMVKSGERLWLVPNKVSTVASNANKPANNKLTTYTVQAGDNLTTLARKFNTTVADLAALNGLSVTDGLLINQKLTVPNTGNNTVVTSNTQHTTPKAVQKSTTYTVQSNDSLTSVANKYGISIAELAAANNLSPDAGLIRGKVITIPAPGTVKIPANTQRTTTTSQRTSSGGYDYVVKAGETLLGVANRHSVPANELAKANNLTRESHLREGQVLRIPALGNITKPTVSKKATTTTYTVVAGDSLTSLARKYGISIQEFAKMNNLGVNDNLFIGQKLTVPNK